MNYGELIKDSFRLTLRNRYLWFFGFFVGGLYGTNVASNFSSGGGGFDPGDFGRPGAGAGPPRRRGTPGRPGAAPGPPRPWPCVARRGPQVPLQRAEGMPASSEAQCAVWK